MIFRKKTGQSTSWFNTIDTIDSNVVLNNNFLILWQCKLCTTFFIGSYLLLDEDDCPENLSDHLSLGWLQELLNTNLFMILVMIMIMNCYVIEDNDNYDGYEEEHLDTHVQPCLELVSPILKYLVRLASVSALMTVSALFERVEPLWSSKRKISHIHICWWLRWCLNTNVMMILAMLAWW